MKKQYSGNSGTLLVPDGDRTVSLSTGSWMVEDVRRSTNELHDWCGRTTVRVDQNEFGAFLNNMLQGGRGEASIQFVGRDNNTGKNISGPIVVFDHYMSSANKTASIEFSINGMPTVT